MAETNAGIVLRASLVGVLGLAAILPVAADDPNDCDAVGDEPDVIVGDIPSVRRWGHVGDITGFSIGTTSCNIGTCWLDWFDDNGFNDENRHPVIGQNLYRLKDGRLEQIGQSWLKHGYFATSGGLCESGCFATNGDHLGVNCSDPYSSFLNGDQDGIGPKFEVNAAIGFHPHPVTDFHQTGNAIYKRLQVHDADLDATLNAGASYVVEGQYVSKDDAGAGNKSNNVSYRPVDVTDNGSNFYEIDVSGSTVRETGAIWSWVASDPQVQIAVVDVPNDGRFNVGVRVTDVGAGLWHYEYAVHNQDSDRAAASFSVPISTSSGVSGIGFHDVDYHSGEPYDGTDWTPSIGATALSWSTTPFGVDPNANALRWGTLYNFRFDTNAPPTAGPVTLGLFKDGSPASVTIQSLIPVVCNEDSICELFEECLCPLDCNTEGTDLDGDGLGQCIDCREADSGLWATPGEVLAVAEGADPAHKTILSWSPPVDPGATTLVYEVLRSTNPADFNSATSICVPDASPTDTTATDFQVPFPGKRFFYLIRATNGCEAGDGGLGEDSDGNPRSGRDCP